MSERRIGLPYAFLSPALIVMALCGIVPLGFVAFYSLHDTFAGNNFIWVGADWYRQVLTSSEFHAALARSIGFSALVLAIEIPLGVYIALRMPARGLMSSICIMVAAVPLLTPYVVVGYLWRALSAPDVGLLVGAAGWLGLDYDMNNPLIVWLTLLLMDAWHWTGLVVLLCFAGLRTIPDEYYRAARIDGARGWATFRYVQLPKLRVPLLIAFLLRFMDSFMIYIEPYIVARGGPGVSTAFLSNELVQTATIQFDLGEGGAMSVIYLAIVVCVSWIAFTRIVPKASPKRGSPAP